MMTSRLVTFSNDTNGKKLNLIRQASSSLDKSSFSIHKHPSREYLDERVEAFEGWKARMSATVLELTAMGLFVSLSYRHSQRWHDWASSLAWHVSMWLIPHVFVHRPKTPLNVAGFAACLATLVLQPHSKISRQVPFVGALHGAASCMAIIRSLQYYLNQKQYAGWRPWRRMFFISAWGWHDFRQLKYVGSEPLIPELKRLGKWASILFMAVMFHLWQGKPADLARDLARVNIAKYFLARWGVGFWTLLAWFNCMDAFVRSLHFWADGHEVRHISEDPWGARTLRDFWGRRWNVPVQELLASGVYAPIARAKWLPMRKTIAKLMVFVVSGVGHTYAISCGGSPWGHLGAMYGFFMLQIPLVVAEHTLNLQGLPWMMMSEIPLAPLFIEPVLTFSHL